ncbi:hypothetical protein BAUCODRAFT_348615 [Baudoinia panamericana UAMH 10762]|uniref:Uncharacterized protein n=1 Tax=Baudoinia panamericana (strain UAMH 10762) TaxID=717646 RepID=M2MSB8_BAUPA|nr:uncharacterized protein BAUCODRAFT_348615 [Baudoinia panamericana UAMH 10762]EMC99756.1 hypothetical protein BAUCODRAFT_348615 [Baudoinia panamericana UAMH 10762]
MRFAPPTPMPDVCHIHSVFGERSRTVSLAGSHPTNSMKSMTLSCALSKLPCEAASAKSANDNEQSSRVQAAPHMGACSSPKACVAAPLWQQTMRTRCSTFWTSQMYERRSSGRSTLAAAARCPMSERMV